MTVYQSKKYKILGMMEQSPDNIMIRIKCDLNPLPGQFVNVSAPGIGEAPISSASYNDKILDLNIRIVGNVTKTLTKMKKGEKIDMRGPYGTGYPMKELKGKNLVLVAGGCGVAPLRGILEYIDLHRFDYKEVYLFFGFRSPEDVLFADEISKWKKQYHMSLSVDEAMGENPFNCPVGFVTHILEKSKVANKNTEVLMCGPPVMMKKSIEILNKKGFDDKQIWVSLERHMKCCTGKCGHCMIHDKYVCIDGPVFRYDEVKGIDE